MRFFNHLVVAYFFGATLSLPLGLLFKQIWLVDYQRPKREKKERKGREGGKGAS